MRPSLVLKVLLVCSLANASLLPAQTVYLFLAERGRFDVTGPVAESSGTAFSNRTLSVRAFG